MPLLDMDAPVKICSNIDGQYHDLLRIFETAGFPPEENYLFLGGYVDYGPQSIETMCLLLAFKARYPENFFMLRGNHECASTSYAHGFYDECRRRYSVRLWKTFVDVFNCLPMAPIIEEKIFCMYGGLSPEHVSMGQIRRILRPTDIPDQGMMCDLIWGNPDKKIHGWGESNRGVSFTLGSNIVHQFLARFGLDLVCRGHQAVEDGYGFFANRRLVPYSGCPTSGVCSTTQARL